MISKQILHRLLRIIGSRERSNGATTEFEVAYHVRIAIDRIRFAIKHTEQFASPRLSVCEANLQLLDALERLESLDRRFQFRSKTQLDRNGNGADNQRRG